MTFLLEGQRHQADSATDDLRDRGPGPPWARGGNHTAKLNYAVGGYYVIYVAIPQLPLLRPGDGLSGGDASEGLGPSLTFLRRFGPVRRLKAYGSRIDQSIPLPSATQIPLKCR